MADIKTKILMLEDDVIDSGSFEKYVRTNRLPYDYTIVTTLSEAKKQISRRKFDLFIADCDLLSVEGLSPVDIFEDGPLILVTRRCGRDTMKEALKSGAHDFVFKDMKHGYLDNLREAIEKAAILHKNNTRDRILMTAVMNTVESIFVTDPKNRIVFVNNAFSELYGWGAEDIHGKKVDMIQEDAAYDLSGISIGLEGDYFHKKKDGSKFPAHVTITRILDEEGKLEAVAWVVRDITERNKLEQQRIDAEKLQSVLEMAGAACHELSQPLQAILGFTELLLMETGKNDRLYEAAMLIKNEADRLRKVFFRITNITHYATLDYPGGKIIIDLDKASRLDKFDEPGI